MSIYDKIDRALEYVDNSIEDLIDIYKEAKELDNGYSTFTNFLELIGVTGTMDAADNISDLKNTIPNAFKKSITKLLLILLSILVFIMLFILESAIAFSILATSLAHPIIMMVIFYIILLFIVLWISSNGYMLDYVMEYYNNIKLYLERKIEEIKNGKKENL